MLLKASRSGYRSGPSPRLTLRTLQSAALAGVLAGTITHAPTGLSQPASREPAPDANAADAELRSASVNDPFSDPLLDLNLTLTALRVTVWPEGNAQMLLLEDDVRFELGVHGFTADAAVVRIETETTDAGPVRHIAATFENARPTPGSGPLAARGPRLLVTTATRGAVRLERPGTVRPADQAPDHPLIAPARARLVEHRRIAAAPGLDLPAATRDASGLPAPIAARRARQRARLAAEAARPDAEVAAADNPDATGAPDATTATDTATATQNPDPTDGSGILPTRGVVAYTMDRWSVRPGDDETAITLAGDVRLVFEDQTQDRVVTLRADKVVLFLRGEDGPPPNLLPGVGATTPDAPATGGLQADQIAGVYLEDHAQISDGDYTVRAPRVYYDLARRRATLLDATFSTYDRENRLPLYLRAEEIRQSSAADFAARNATLSTSAFAIPHFSIGADELALRRYAKDGESETEATGTFFTAKGTRLKSGGRSFFYWPYLAAHGLDTPLRRVGLDFSANNGVELTTRWDLNALLGRPRPEGTNWEGDLDIRGDHGLALGTRGNYRTESALGDFRGYLLVNDDGDDDVAGRTIPHDSDIRGHVVARHRQPVGRGYRLSIEGAFASDPSYLETFFPDETYAAKEYETSAHLQKQEGSTALDVLAKTRLSDFVEQQSLLQSDGFTVERFPEATHRVIGGSLFDGRVTWFSEARAGQLRLRPSEDSPIDRDFTDADSLTLFGIPSATSFEERASALNLPTNTVRRFDLRQEVSLPLKGGPADAWNLTPYAVGRITAYDDDFAEFNGGNDDQVRLRGEVGVRVGTLFSKTMPAVRSELLDLHGLRHIVEPQATLFAAGSNLDREDLPFFDREVEDLAEGAGLRLGLTQTWQTKRGATDRQRTVDWLTLRTDLILRSEGDAETPIPRFDDFRPEFAVGGDHLYTELLWMVTDTLGVAGELTYSFDTDRAAQWRLGASLEHSPRLTTELGYEEIDVFNSRLLRLGADYILTRKYRIGISQTFDLGDTRNRNLAVRLDRRIPQWTLRLQADVNQLDDEQRIGITLIPNGTSRDPRVF